VSEGLVSWLLSTRANGLLDGPEIRLFNRGVTPEKGSVRRVGVVAIVLFLIKGFTG
jgi:hypothetical protein